MNIVCGAQSVIVFEMFHVMYEILNNFVRIYLEILDKASGLHDNLLCERIRFDLEASGEIMERKN